MGPIALFDKSFIEMLSLDEATMFNSLYSSVICPIFYTEVLADLSKKPPGQRTAEKIVADVARKTPILHSAPNVTHSTLCIEELLGHPIEMRGVPAIAGGRPVRHSDGKVGVVYDQSPEAKAFDRWQRQQFYELEREFASRWREQLKAAKHADMAKLAKAALKISASPKTLEDAFSDRERGCRRQRTAVPNAENRLRPSWAGPETVECGSEPMEGDGRPTIATICSVYSTLLARRHFLSRCGGQEVDLTRSPKQPNRHSIFLLLAIRDDVCVERHAALENGPTVPRR